MITHARTHGQTECVDFGHVRSWQNEVRLDKARVSVIHDHKVLL